VPVDKHTLLSTKHANIFALGDASDIPASKAGSVAHFACEVFVGNFLQHVQGQAMTGSFDGHANCFVESGDQRALLIDFNYDTEPLPGKYPLPVVGPILFHQNALVYASWALVVLIAFYLGRTRPGLNVRAVGENPGDPTQLGPVMAKLMAEARLNSDLFGEDVEGPGRPSHDI